jgi:formylglycine-generating enzyme required for sulfatase activity
MRLWEIQIEKAADRPNPDPKTGSRFRSMMEWKALSLACLITLSFCLPASAQASTPGRDLAGELGMQFVSIPAGSFHMGSPSSESHRCSNEDQHLVTVSPFELMTT